MGGADKGVAFADSEGGASGGASGGAAVRMAFGALDGGAVGGTTGGTSGAAGFGGVTIGCTTCGGAAYAAIDVGG